MAKIDLLLRVILLDFTFFFLECLPKVETKSFQSYSSIMLVSKVLDIKFGVKHRITNYINENSDEIGFEFIGIFFINHYCFIAGSHEDFMNNNRPKKRALIFWIYNILMWLINIRFLLLAIVNKPWIWTLFADPIYIMRKPNVISLFIFISGVMSSLRQIVFYNFENCPEMRPILQLHSTNRYHYRLSDRYYRKFCLKSRFMAKYVLGLLIKAIVFGSILSYISLIIKAYFDSDFEFSIIIAIINTIVLFFWLNHCFAVIWGGFVILFIVSLHLRYSFRQIKDQMKQNLRFENLVLIIDKIHKHDYYSKLTLEWNKHVKYLLFIVYFLSPPSLNTVVYYTLSEVNIYLRVFYVLLVYNFFYLTFTANYICSSLYSLAHDFTSDLYAFLSNKRIIIPVQHRLKISAFVENLCGPVIGFYCYDFFPFTNYEFFQYLSIAFCNYFLMSNLIFNV